MQHIAVPATRTRDESAHRILRAQTILNCARRRADDARRDAEQLAWAGEKHFAAIMTRYAQLNEAHVQTAQDVIFAEMKHWSFRLHVNARYAYQLRIEHLAHKYTQLSNDYANAAMDMRVAGEADFAFVFGELHRIIGVRAKHLWNAHSALVAHPRVSVESFKLTFC